MRVVNEPLYAFVSICIAHAGRFLGVMLRRMQPDVCDMVPSFL